MQAFAGDLKFAQTAGVYVEVRLLSGERLLTGVHDVNEEEGFVSLYAPQNLGDRFTTRKVALDTIESVTVTKDNRPS
jgi:hypothetical protein